MGGAVRRGSCDVDAIPPELTPPTAPTRGTEECGRSTAHRGLSRSANSPISLKNMAVAGLHREGGFSPLRGVDIRHPERLYKLNSARRRLGATARLRSSSLIFGDQASDPDRRPRASTALRFTGGRDRPVPGCLTGESEERETWTAESLRAASPIGDVYPSGCGRTRLRRSTFQVNTPVVQAAGVGPRQTL